MTQEIRAVKKQLDDSITQLCEVSWMFSKNPRKDFTRTRKLPFRKIISFVLSMEGGTLAAEMLKHFGCSPNIASISAFTQQRGKLNSSAFPSLFDLFARKMDSHKLYKGFRLIAVDGSNIQIPTDPAQSDSYFPGSNDQSPYNLLHLSAMYDLLHHTYIDACLLGKKQADERGVLCAMVDRSIIENGLLIADRGYESYNVMAHIQEKGWHYLIRIQDIANSRGIVAGLDLPDSDEFDLLVDLSLTTKQTNHVKLLCKNKNQYKHLKKDFDFLPRINSKHDPAVFYNLPFRIVRFKISDDSYETVVTNLDASLFPKGYSKGSK